MSFELSKEDYLELWTYFEDRADNVKEAMFKTITWTIGFAAALLGFIFFKLVEFDPTKARVPLKWLVIASGAAGIVICLYSWFVLSESGRHIKRNWDRAAYCGKQFKDYDLIMKGGQKGFIEVWNRLLIIVVLFAIAFAIVLVWALEAA